MIPFPFQIGGLGFVSDQAWTPAQLKIPPKVWINDSSGVTDVAGNASQWNDVSGNARHFIQGTAANRPLIVSGGLNGRRTIRFDGTNDFMTDNGGTMGNLFNDQTTGFCFAVYKKTALDGAGTDRMIFNNTRGTDGGTRFAMYASHVAVNNSPRLMVRRLDADAGASLSSGATPGTAWTMLLMTMDWGQGDGTVYANEVQTAQNLALTTSGNTTASPSNSATSIGAQFTGNIAADIELAELVISSGAALPNATEITNLFNYARGRWGL